MKRTLVITGSVVALPFFLLIFSVFSTELDGAIAIIYLGMLGAAFATWYGHLKASRIWSWLGVGAWAFTFPLWMLMLFWIGIAGWCVVLACWIGAIYAPEASTESPLPDLPPGSD